MSYLEEYLKNEERISATNSVEFDIFRSFYQNVIHEKNFLQSVVKYKGKKIVIVFSDWRDNPLHKLADYFYKILFCKN
jgi:hypothetical protein